MKKYKYIIGKKQNRNPIHHPFVAYDSETDKEGNFKFAYLFGEYKDHHNKIHKVDKFFDNKFLLQAYLLKLRGCKLIGYNIAYDLFYIEDIIDDNTRLEGKNFITAKIKNGGVSIMDLMNLTSEYSLYEWGYFLKMNEKGEEWNIWLELKKKEKEDINLLDDFDLKFICKKDTEFTWILTQFIEDFMVYELKIPLSNTAGMCALNLYQYYFCDQTWMRDLDEINNFEREGYRGGRSECFIRGKQKIKHYDINAMYLSILKDYKFPNPCKYFHSITGNNYKKFYNQGLLMIMKVKVEVPQQKIAPLPFLLEKKKYDKKLIFPCGVFEGVYTSVELKTAEKYGAKILECKEYIVYFETDFYFKKFAEFVFAKRKEYKMKGNKGMDLLIKKIGNSFYGKFAQKNPIQKSKWIKLEDYHGSLLNKLILERNGTEYIYLGSEKSIKVDSIHTFPCISVFVTSYARIKLLEIMKENEDNVVYCDTDSLFLLSSQENNINISDDAGFFKYEGEKELIFYRPKLYGEKSKGVPKMAKKIFEDEKEIHYTYEKPLKRNESIRKGEQQNKWISMIKIIQKQDDKRIWLENNLSMPIRIPYVTIR